MFRSPQRPTWIEIDESALGRNVAEVVRELGGVALMAVVKADGYGHGAATVARVAVGNGAAWVGTATVAEASQLRRQGVTAPILVLGYTPPEEVLAAVAANLAITVFDLAVLEALERAGTALGQRACAHLEVDTGMSRLGVAPEQVATFAAAASRCAHVDLEGCYTHFRHGADPLATREQLARLLRALDASRGAGVEFRLRHAANSAAWKTVPEARLDLVRLGIELLGLTTPDGRRREPVLSLRTTVAQVREVEAGTFVGYEGGFQAPRAMRIATIPIGYGDGFRRTPSNWGMVLIGGRARPLVGHVCMDLAMVDVSDPPEVGASDVVTLLGRDGDARLRAETVAQRLGTINYEVTTALSARVPRESLSAGIGLAKGPA